MILGHGISQLFSNQVNCCSSHWSEGHALLLREAVTVKHLHLLKQRRLAALTSSESANRSLDTSMALQYVRN